MKIGADIRICDKVYDFPLNYGLSIVAVSVDSIVIMYISPNAALLQVGINSPIVVPLIGCS